MTDPELKPCPACGSKANRAFFGSRDILCSNYECEAAGPINDPDGAKWNALPRRGTGAEMEELRAARRDWAFVPHWGDPTNGSFRVRNAIDAVLAAAQNAEVAQLTKERDEARAEIARLVANPPDVSFCPEVDRLKGQVALLKQMLRDEIAREGGDGK